MRMSSLVKWYRLLLALIVIVNVTDSIINDSLQPQITPLEDESLNNFLNSNTTKIPKNIHKLAIKEARRLLQSGRCNHVYLDLGSNVGMQIRKFLQPLSYPLSKVWPPIFDVHFGKYDIKTNNRSDVCVFGFEPNPVHNNVLKKTEMYYQHNGFSVVIFRETAIAIHHGNATFLHDLTSKPKHQEWGGSMLENGQNKKFNLQCVYN